MKVKVTDHHLYISTPYSAKNYVQNVLNGVWSKAENMYRFPKNYNVLMELATAFPVLKTNPEIVALAQRLRQSRQYFLSQKVMTDCAGDPRLRPYQRVDVNYLKQVPSAGIFNEPRTGKTPTSILLMKELGSKKNLVVCPASLIWNWAKEFEKWFPEIRTFVVHGTPKQKREVQQAFRKECLKEPSALIVSKDTWKKVYEQWDDFTFDCAFVDEAHYLRNYKTEQSKAIFKIRSIRRYALTGTPTVRHPSDIWGILHFLYPEKFTGFWQFADRYFEVRPNYMGHKEPRDVKVHREQELQEIVGFVSVQRKRKEVMQWLPDKEHIPFYCKMEGRQREMYNEMKQFFAAYLTESGDDEILASNVLTQLLRLRQLCIDPRLVGSDVKGAKTTALLEFIEDNVTPKNPLVVMTKFTSYLRLIRPEIERLGFRVGMIHGEMSNKEKFTAAQAFQAGKLDVLLCNIQSAGTGFTLDRADTIVFIDKEWNPADNEQAEDRITPTTPDRVHNHNIISFICVDSIDEQIEELLAAKKSLTDVVNKGGYQAILRLLGR